MMGRILILLSTGLNMQCSFWTAEVAPFLIFTVHKLTVKLFCLTGRGDFPESLICLGKITPEFSFSTCISINIHH